MKTQKIVFFDTETGGVDPAVHPLIQIAAVAVALPEWKPIEWLELKIAFEESKADPEALAKNGYSREVWEAQAVHPTQARTILSEFFRRHATLRKVSKTKGTPYYVARLCSHDELPEEARLAGHNSRFDACFLDGLYRNQDGTTEFIPAATYEPLDTLAAARWYFTLSGEQPPPDYKLKTLCDHLGIELDSPHEALNDVIATAKIGHWLCDAMGFFEPAG